MKDVRENTATLSASTALPLKTVATAVWFVLLGTMILGLYRGFGRQRDAVDGAGLEMALSGPLSAAASSETAAAMVEDEAADIARLSRTRPANPNDSAPEPPRTPHEAIADVNDQGLCHFYTALDSVDSGREQRPVRVLHYGDSILTTDEISGRIRRVLQTRFGDGGHGFVLLGKPWRWYQHLDVVHGASGKWDSRPVTSSPLEDGIYGLGGVAFETTHRDAKAWVGTAKDGPVGQRVARFDISYLEQPGGGSFDLAVDDRVVATVKSAGADKRGQHYLLNVQPGPAQLELRTHGDGPLRVFGAVLESDHPGVVYDSLAINGARASILERFDEAEWQAELKHRAGDLVVLMFGANEGHNEQLPLGDYKKQLESVIATLRGGAGEASCLIVGPLDQAERRDDGSLGSRHMPTKLGAMQREVALAAGCAYFDTIAAMGGKDSMARWSRLGLGGGDFIHPTEHGARKIGSWISEAILAGYERFVFEGKKCASNVTSS